MEGSGGVDTMGEKTEAAFRAAVRHLEASPSDPGVLGGLLDVLPAGSACPEVDSGRYRLGRGHV